MNYATTLLKRRVTDPATREFATEILGECRRVTEIVRALQSFARADERQVGSVNVREATDDVVRLLRSSLMEDRIDVVVRSDAELPEVHQGAARIKQVIMNLFANARDALRSRSPRRTEAKRIHVTVRTEQRDGEAWLVLKLADNGDGIEPGLLGRIFDPFFTTKRRARGPAWASRSARSS